MTDSAGGEFVDQDQVEVFGPDPLLPGREVVPVADIAAREDVLPERPPPGGGATPFDPEEEPEPEEKDERTNREKFEDRMKERKEEKKDREEDKEERDSERKQKRADKENETPLDRAKKQDERRERERKEFNKDEEDEDEDEAPLCSQCGMNEVGGEGGICDSCVEANGENEEDTGSETEEEEED